MEDHHPLLVLHGGPGFSHDYLETFEDIASTGRRVVFYDQLGGGRSDHVHDHDLWSVDLFLDELRNVREQLGLGRVHIAGQSWGATLAMEHALTSAPGIESLVLCDPLADTHQWVSEANRLRRELPKNVQEALLRHERDGTTDSEEYQAAMMEYYRRHVCRTEPWPECLMRSFTMMASDPEVYSTLWGSSEFHVTGKLKDYSVLPRLYDVHVPTLLMSGRYDEATPDIVRAVQERIVGAEWRVFENSSHMPHCEEREQFMSTLSDFLGRVERRG